MTALKSTLNFSAFSNRLNFNSIRYKRLSSHYFGFKHFYSSAYARQAEVTAGVLIIGDEILNGQTEDKNSPFLIQNLNSSGIKINKIVILPDEVNAIAKEVSCLHRTCTVVLTSGGIGPTHDDVTFEAVAKAIGDELVLNQELCDLFKEYFGPQADENPAVLKFSSIPKSAILNFNTAPIGYISKFPLVSVKNIYILPGVPWLLQKGFDTFKSKFLLSNKPSFTDTIYLAIDEFSLTSLLNEAVELYKDKVKFGSYPSFTHNYYKVKITMESLNKDAIDKAKDFFRKGLPNYIVTLNKNVFKSATQDVSILCKEYPPFSLSASIVDKALKTYDLSEICICFNGGKDCTALLHLLYAFVHKTKPNDWVKVQALYVRNGETFKEVEDFIKSSVKNYNLNLTVLEGDLKTKFSDFLNIQPQIRAVLMGTRRCDPGSEYLRYFHPTDEQWPRIMRIFPILDWSYSDVWSFIRKLQVPYCVLYDRGYTSLGLKDETIPNSKLIVSKDTKFRSYKPAYMYNGDEERNGRL